MRSSLVVIALFAGVVPTVVVSTLAFADARAPITAAGPGDASGAILDAQAQTIAARLRCPVCQNESVADSPAGLAAQMRGLIRKKLEAGQTPEQITAYFVGRYGEWILLEPPRRGLLWVVWLAPIGSLAAGILVTLVFLRGTRERLRP